MEPTALNSSKKKKANLIIPIIVAVVSLVVNQYVLWHLNAPPALQAIFFTVCVGLFFSGSWALGFYTFVYRAMIPLTIGFLILFAYDQAFSNPYFKSLLIGSNDNFKSLEMLFEILSTLYAICTAFLLWKGLTDHDNLRKLLGNESSYIERLDGYLHYFNSDVGNNADIIYNLRINISEYIGNIIQGDKIKASEKNTKLLRECGYLISNLSLKDANDRVALAETMKSLSDLASARSERISQMEIKMSPYLLISLSIMSLAVIFPFFSQESSGNFVQETCIFILSSVLSFLLITLLDISRPFDGFWSIKNDAFKAIKKTVDIEIASGPQVVEHSTNMGNDKEPKDEFPSSLTPQAPSPQGLEDSENTSDEPTQFSNPSHNQNANTN